MQRRPEVSQMLPLEGAAPKQDNAKQKKLRQLRARGFSAASDRSSNASAMCLERNHITVFTHQVSSRIPHSGARAIIVPVTVPPRPFSPS